jgi:threonine aldolase
VPTVTVGAVPVDLRSDTMTRPTDAMRAAMASAEVGDDGWGEDPTVRRLEETFAERVGKAAGLFVPSGTMANQVALRTLAGVGQMVVAGRRQHVVMSEMGAVGVNGSFALYTVDDVDGRLDLVTAAEAVAGGLGHSPPVAVIAVENTHMAAGGKALAADEVAAVAALGPPVHLDGARLFNAAVALGVPVADLAAPATTVTACMSKGLGAPIGSVLAGPADLIAEAREHRTRLGGGMRQAGIVAAAGLVALSDMVDRLAEDHARAERLAEAAGVDPSGIDTNIVLVPHDDPEGFVKRLADDDVLAAALGPKQVRFVTYKDLDDAGIDHACQVLAKLT